MDNGATMEHESAVVAPAEETAATHPPHLEAETPEQEAKRRAAVCSDAIRQLLAHYRCSIAPRWEAESVGDASGKVLLTASFGVVAR